MSDQYPSPIINAGDRFEIIEGSWAGRRGVVTSIQDRYRVQARLDDDPDTVVSVVGCTLAHEVDD